MYDHSGSTTVLSDALGELSTGQSLPRVHIRRSLRADGLVDDRNDTLGSRRVRVGEVGNGVDRAYRLCSFALTRRLLRFGTVLSSWIFGATAASR